MSFSVRKIRFKLSFTRVNTSPNSGVRWWMIGIAPAAEISGGIGVGPGDIKRYLFIMVAGFLSYRGQLTRILVIIFRDGYILGQTFYKLLLSHPPPVTSRVFRLAEPGPFEGGEGRAGVPGGVAEAGRYRGRKRFSTTELLGLDARANQALRKV